MKPRNLSLILLCSGFILLTVAVHLYGACVGWLNFRDQHLGTAITYARGSIDLLRPVIVGFNAQATPVPQELPLWQAAAALALRWFGPWWGWANVVSLLAYYSILWPLYRIVAAHSDARRAWWTLLFFVAQPNSILNAGIAGTDGFSIAMAIWFLYCADSGLRTGRVAWFLAAALTGALAAVSKAPFFMAAGLTAFFLLLAHARKSRVAWVGLIGAGAFAALAFVVWTKYGDSQYARAEFPLVELRVSENAWMRFWYFGDWSYRLNPANWLKGGWRLMVLTSGSIGLMALPLFGIFVRRNALGLWWVLGGIVPTLIFSHLILHHGHYYLMFSGGLAILCAEAVTWFEERVPDSRALSSAALPSLVGLALFLSAIQGLIDSNVILLTDRFPRAMAGMIKERTSPEDKLIIQGGGWGGQALMLADRSGLAVWNTDLLEKPETRERLKSLGYTKLVMISESPLLAAVQASRPGGAGRAREFYRSVLTPTVATWPALVETDDLLIKSIP